MTSRKGWLGRYHVQDPGLNPYLRKKRKRFHERRKSFLSGVRGPGDLPLLLLRCEAFSNRYALILKHDIHQEFISPFLLIFM